jgi:hypothetical protein
MPVGDVVGYVNLIASIHGNRDLAQRRRWAARTQALRFDWRLVAEQMIAAYAAAKSSDSAVTDLGLAKGHLARR